MDQHSASHFIGGHLEVMCGRGPLGGQTPTDEEPPGGSGGSGRGEHGQLEEARRLTEASYRALVEQMPAIAYTAALDDMEGANYFSPQAAGILGYKQEELLANPDLWLRSIHPDDRAIVMAEYERRKTTLGTFRVEYRFVRADGALIWLRDEAVFILDSSGRPRLMQDVVYDITEIEAQEQRLREGAGVQARLLEQLVSTQEAERRRLQMDIHDGPLQSLGVSLMALDRAARRLERGEGETCMRELRFLREALTETVSELRGMLTDLGQDALTLQGLVPALRKHLDRFSEMTGIRVRLESNLHGRLPREYELLVYRLAQESLSNVRKHSTAHNVIISVVERGGVLYVKIKDDGIGFDVGAMERTIERRRDGEQLGLRSMRERALAVGGDLRIFSSAGRGTTLHFTCPIPPA